MFRVPKRWIPLLLAGLLPATVTCTKAESISKKRSLPQLEERLKEIDIELDRLARKSLRSGVGAIGYRSQSHKENGAQEWVEVAWDHPCPIDEIVLVPTLWRDSKDGFQADGFPEAFRVVAGTDSERTGEVIATYDSKNRLLPRIAPLTIPVKRISASWVRIEAIQLSRRAFDSHYIFQLSELLVFSGNRNVALRRPVNASSVHNRDLVHAWDQQFLTDGHMPYLMCAAQGEPSVSYIGSVNRHSALTLDLGKVYPLSEIHLQAVDQSDTVPQAYPGNLGIPQHLLIEGAVLPDFSDAVPLLDLQLGDFTATGPVMMWPFPETPCRYVRIGSPELDPNARFGFAEIELFSEGKSIARNKPVYADGTRRPPDEPSNRSFTALTDGRNLYGNILPVRDWMSQLARRHDLEAERPLVTAELNLRYASQKRNLWLMTWIAALLAAAVGFIILIDRMLRMRQASKMRERFAADLHDELGANIHTIGLLGDLARDTESREELLELLDRSREFTERSGVAIRNCANMLEARSLCEDLVKEMKRSASSLLADLNHHLSVEGEEFMQDLRPSRRIDTFFFYKECLTNIIRHSGATSVTTSLTATPKDYTLTVTDNGHGLNGEVPHSLNRRARLLGGQFSIKNSSDGGTCVVLKVKRRRRTLFRKTSNPLPKK